MVPEGWSYRTLEKASKIIDCKHRTPLYVNSGIPVISPGTIKWGEIDFDTPIKRVTQIEYESLMDHCDIEAGDLVLSRNQSIGVASYVKTVKPFVLGQDTVLIKPKGNTDSRFLFYCFQDNKTQRIIFKLAGGSTFSRINLRDIRKLKLVFPPLPEQQKIAQILSTWDKVIDKLEALISAKQQRKKALMQQLLTGKVRLPGFKGEWDYIKAKELFGTISRKKNVDEELLAVTQDQGVLPRSLLERKVVMPEGSTKGYKLVVPGNFIISLRSFQGGLEYSNYRGLVSPAYTVLKPIVKISDGFYRHYFKSYNFIGNLAVTVVGIRDGKQINYDDFSFLKLPYPKLEEQQKIAAVLSAADAEIEKHQQQLQALKQQKKGLMQQLLTGKKRVKLAADQLPATGT
ncbi:MAG: restriction endonuclease subunit S [Gammaproteobacteria bacterium]